MRDHYLPDKSLADRPRAAPLRARDLSKLPPALIVTAEYDVLRDEAEIFARRLREAGTPVELIRYDGQVHGFFGQTRQVDRAREAITDACLRLRAAFGSP